ncbi:TPA: adhesin, partial [Haemophilus influenzae]
MKENSHFNLYSKTDGSAVSTFPNQGLGGIYFNTDTIFDINKTSTANFTFIYPIAQVTNRYHSEITGNLTVTGGGKVKMKFSSYDNRYYTTGIAIKSSRINVTNGSSLSITGDMPAKKIFDIKNDLVINATNSNVSITEVEGTDTKLEYGLYADGNITVEGGNVTLGSNKAKTHITKNVSVKSNANLTLSSANFNVHKGALTIGGSANIQGNLTANGDTVEVAGDVIVSDDAKFKAETKNNLNITGTFTNNGTSEINIKQG